MQSKGKNLLVIYKYKYKIGDRAIVNLGDGLAHGLILDQYLDPNPIYRVDLLHDNRYQSIMDLGEKRIFITVKEYVF